MSKNDSDYWISKLHAALEDMAALYVPPSPGSKRDWFPRPLPWPHIETVVEAIEHLPKLSTLTKLYQLTLGSSTGIRLTSELLASALVRRAYALSSGPAAISELLDLVRTDEAGCRLTLVLAGVKVDNAVEIAPNLILRPFSSVQPPPWYKDIKEEQHWPLSRTLERVGPSSVLVKMVNFSPVFIDSERGPDHYPEIAVQQLRTVANCIALVAGGPVAKLPLWCESNDVRLPIQMSGVTFNDWNEPGMAMPYVAEIERIRTVIADYSKFDGSKGPIDVSMARLAAAWGNWQRESRAIDLGLAIESILMCEVGSKERQPSTEIKYKLGLRAAWLLGNDLNERERIYRFVRQLYDFRSQAAHTGHVKVTLKNWQSVDEKIEQGIALTGQLIVMLLSHGRWPDWTKLVLGAVSESPFRSAPETAI